VKLKLLSALAMTLLASVALAQNTAPAKDTAKTPVLTRAQFDQLLTKPDQLLVIDVRRPDEVSSIGGLPVYLSIQLADLEKSVAWIPKDRKIVAVSNHAAKGFNVVGRIGVQTYEAEGGKVAHIAVPAPQATEQKTAQAK
jgi:rhodanese-related sulfurtransferase